MTGQRPSWWPQACRRRGGSSRRRAAAGRELRQHALGERGSAPALGRRRARRAVSSASRARPARAAPPRRPAGVSRTSTPRPSAGSRVARREACRLEPVDHAHGARVAQAQAAGQRVDRPAARPLVQRRRAPPAARRSCRRVLGRVAEPVAERDDHRADHVEVVIHLCRKHICLDTHDRRDDRGPLGRGARAQREDVARLFAPRERRCPECGATQRGGGRDCANCGADLTARYGAPAATRGARCCSPASSRPCWSRSRSRSSPACATTRRTSGRARRSARRRGWRPSALRQIRDGKPVRAAAPAAAAGEEVARPPRGAAERARGADHRGRPRPRPAGTLDGDIQGTRCTPYPATDARRAAETDPATRAARYDCVAYSSMPRGQQGRTAVFGDPFWLVIDFAPRPLRVVQDLAARRRGRERAAQRPGAGAVPGPRRSRLTRRSLGGGPRPARRRSAALASAAARCRRGRTGRPSSTATRARRHDEPDERRR